MMTDCDCFGLKMDESQWRERERDIVCDMVLERERERWVVVGGEREGKVADVGERRGEGGYGEREGERERERERRRNGLRV